MILELQPITFREAAAFVNKYHSHHKAPQGHVFSIAVNDGNKVVGVIICGHPTARLSNDGYTLEITRCCVEGHVKNAASKLYGAAWRAAKSLGYHRIITYTLVEESGESLRGAGFKAIRTTRGGSWSRDGRPRIDTHPIGQKNLWEKIDHV